MGQCWALSGNPNQCLTYQPIYDTSSDKRSVIIDLSWPKAQFVNSGVDSDRYLNVDFVLTYPSIDNIT